jgi:hypothetical protein
VPGGSTSGTVSPNAGNPTGRTDPSVGNNPATGTPGAPQTNSAVTGPPSGQSGLDAMRPSTSGSAGGGVSSPRRPARAVDVPTDERGKPLNRAPEDEALDRKMQICKGC